MGSIYKRRNSFWVKFRNSPNGSWWLRIYNPKLKRLNRFNLKTEDRARAELISQKVELAFELSKPLLQGVEIPEEISAALEIESSSIQSPHPHQIYAPAPNPSPRLPRLKIADAIYPLPRTHQLGKRSPPCCRKNFHAPTILRSQASPLQNGPAGKERCGRNF